MTDTATNWVAKLGEIGTFIVLVGAWIWKVVTDILDRRERRAATAEAKIVAAATAVAVGVVTTKVAENTVITEKVHDIADGRLSSALKELADSKADTARMVSEEVARGAADLIAKAKQTGEEMLAGAQAAAKQVLEDARVRAEASAKDLLEAARKEAAALLAAAPPRTRGRKTT